MRSQYLGVSWNGVEERWRVRITVDGKVKFVGRRRTEDEAARLYDHAARKVLGPDAPLNFPGPSEVAAPRRRRAGRTK